MNKHEKKIIAIIGGGASATLLVNQIIKCADKSSNIDLFIIDKDNAFNAGVAYQISHPSFLLNVHANKMGADPDQPAGFFEWLCEFPQLWRGLNSSFEKITYEANDFVPRMIYARYLRWIYDESVLLASQKNISVFKIFGHVVNVSGLDPDLQVIMQTGEIIKADIVVFCTGNNLPKHQYKTSTIFSSPYCAEFLRQDWSKIKDTLIVGSGLSMVDAVQYLAHQNYSGNIHVYSRHGLIPLPHTEVNSQQSFFSLKRPSSAKAITREIRENIELNKLKGIAWQEIVNSLRKHTNSVWLSLIPEERTKLTKIMPWWNIARHRIPLTAYEYLNELRKKGKLIITKGNVKKITQHSNHFSIELNNNEEVKKSEKLIICSGYKNGYTQLHSLCDKLLTDEEMRFSLREDRSNFKISATHRIYAIGPALTGILIETTAIQEIREQSASIASAMLKSE